jgi:hypothetical protein
MRGSGKLRSGNRHRGASAPAVAPRIVSSNVTHAIVTATSPHSMKDYAKQQSGNVLIETVIADQTGEYPMKTATPERSIGPSKPPATWLIEQQRPPRPHPHGSPRR